jgi:hypothetical protein
MSAEAEYRNPTLETVLAKLTAELAELRPAYVVVYPDRDGIGIYHHGHPAFVRGLLESALEELLPPPGSDE